MAKQGYWLLCCVLILTVTLPAAQVQAAPLRLARPRPDPINYFGINGELATADFAELVDGCLYNEALVFMGSFTFKNAPGAPTATPRLSLIVSSQNLCTGEWPIYALGSVPLAADVPPIDKQLTSAHVQTPVTIYDSDLGVSYSLVVDVTWTGVGDLINSASHSHSHAPGCTTIFRTAERYRTATASGSISGAGLAWTSNDLFFAQLHSLHNGTIQVGCG